MHLTYIYNHILQHLKNVRIIIFRHTALIQIFYLNIPMSFFSKRLYEYGQLLDALNMFFVKNISVHNYNTLNKDKLCLVIAKQETETFDLLVSMFGIIYVTI